MSFISVATSQSPVIDVVKLSSSYCEMIEVVKCFVDFNICKELNNLVLCIGCIFPNLSSFNTRSTCIMS